MAFINEPVGKPVVSSYMIVRTRGAVTDSVVANFPIDSDCLADPFAFSYVDTLPGGGGTGPYLYSVRSVPPAGFGGTSRDFGTIALDASSEVAEPHFWAAKPDYQERNYALSMGVSELQIPPTASVAVAFPLSFFVDLSDYPSFNPANLTLERATKYIPDSGTYEAVSLTTGGGGLSYNYNTSTGLGEIVCTINTSTTDFKATGGIAYRLHYHDPSTGFESYFPRERASKKHFVWSAVNNRVMGATWFNYMMNCEGPTWAGTLGGFCQFLGSGSADPTSTGHNVTYDSVFLDSAMAISVEGAHNNVRPYEYDSIALCVSRTVATVKSLCDLDVVDIVPNTPNLPFVDAFVEADGTAHHRFRGVMDESVVYDDNGEQKLANMIWKFRGHPFTQNLVMNGFDFGNPDYGVANRTQAVAAYLFSRDPFPSPSNPVHSLFGYGPWANGNAASAEILTILPEQMLNVGNVIGEDPFGSVAWPGLAAWQSLCGNNTDAANWLATNALLHRQVGARHYAAMRFELEDGLPNEMTEVAVVWDISPDGTPGVYTMESLFPEKAGANWYALELDGIALLDGGVLSSSPVALNWPIPTIANQATLYFTKPVHSPIVEPLALSPIPATGGLQGQLKIAVSQWNGMPLAEVRVDGTSIGWGKNLILTHAGDGIYTYTGTGSGTSIGVHHDIPVVATGTDGLKMYAKVAVEAAEDVVIASAAEYPLHANSLDHKVVFALDITSFVPLNASLPVEVASSEIFGPLSPVTLRDDGSAGTRPNAEDQVAGDGIFTSDRVVVNTLSAGAYTAQVTVHAAGGDPVMGNVSVDVIASDAEFQDISGSAGALAIRSGATAAPYASIVFHTGKNGIPGLDAMIVTFADAGTPPLFMQRTNPPGTEPSFARRENQWFGGASLPVGTRGVTYCDQNADNKSDVFLCGATASNLLRNGGTALAPQFADVTTAVFGSEASLLNGALMAAWSDFDNGKGEDLYVTTSSYTGPISEIGAQTGVTYEARVFQNDGNGSLRWRFLRTPSDGSVCLSGTWANLNGGTVFPMLVSPWVFDGHLLAVHHPTHLEDGGYTLITLPWPIWENGAPANLKNVNSITVFNYDGDGYPDLLITDTGGAGKAAILRNNYHIEHNAQYNYDFAVHEFELVPLDSGRRWNGASVADFDGNGIDDILLLPQSGEPALFMASAGTTTPVYRDLAYTLGLRGGATSGAVAYDFGGSSLADLYMGRLGTGQFLYKNVGTSTQNWLDVDLSTVGNSCSSLFGTEVVVSRGGRQWRKWVDGGSGRGGQEPGKLRFYLGDTSGQVSVTVNYPSGDSDAASGVPLGGSFVSIEDTPITLKVGTKANPDPRFTCELGPGTMDWVFRWRTVGIKGDERQDAVTIENYLGYGNDSSCYMGIDPGTPRVLRLGDVGVTTEIYWDGTDWQHELRWSGLPCMPGCQYRFKVTSGIGNGTTSTGPTKVMPAINFCMPDPDPNQQ